MFNIMLEFLKPLPLIFRISYYHFAEFSTLSYDDVTVDDVTVTRDVYKKDGDWDRFSRLKNFIVDKYTR